jgi:hypothetical protein
MAQNVTIRLNRLDLRNLAIRSATKLIEKVTTQVVVEAKLDSRGPYSTGRTAASITKRVYVEGNRVYGDVRAGTRYAHIAHNGARPHIIRARRPGGNLRFYWRKVGHVVTFPYVSHPGMQGKHFLSGPMERVGRRNRFIVLTFND